MNQESLNSYVSQVATMTEELEAEGKTLEELVPLVDRFLSKALEGQEGDSGSTEAFFKGEKAFYKGQYDLALKHYLSAKSIPDYRFFCYRTSAYASKEMGRGEKALDFAKRALAIRPTDHLSQKLVSELDGGSFEPSSLADNEVEALENIFEESSTAHPFESGIYNGTTEASTTESIERNATMETTTVEGASPELDQLAESDYSFESDTTSQFIQNELGITLDSSQTLEQRIAGFQHSRQRLLNEYLRMAEGRPELSDSFLAILHGWCYDETTSTTPSAAAGSEAARFLLSQGERTTSGGYFLRWHGTGIAINPGPGFLNHFHNEGFHIRDIDMVIVTKDAKESYANVQAIYELNYQLNTATPELHIIHYYLNQQAHQTLAPALKPNFKQERHTIHCLELYVDSPEIEKIELSDTISLHYFPTSSHETSTQAIPKGSERQIGRGSSLGMTLELSSKDGREIPGAEGRTTLRLGYVAGTMWSPLLSHHLGRCDLLLTGFGSTDSSDYGKLKYAESCLGYFGIYSLLEEVSPSLLVYSEISGHDGDIRLEIAKKMRQEYLFGENTKTVIVPGDTGLHVDLEQLALRCSVTGAHVRPQEIKVIKSKDSFGKLQYLSPSCFI